MKNISRHAPSAEGVQNLLHNCVHVRAGDRVLIIGETPDSDHFDPRVCDRSAEHARHLGAAVTVMQAPPVAGPENFPLDVAQAIEQSDHTIFFSRLGDQMRFCPLPGAGTKTVCYTANELYLDDDFARLPYGLFRELHDHLVAIISDATSYRIRCPHGTNLEVQLEGKIRDSLWSDEAAPTGANRFSVAMFPMIIFPPIPCTGLNGNLNLSHWLTSTSTHQDDDSVLFIPLPVIANIEDSRIANIQGDGDSVQAVKRFYKQKSGQFGGDTWAVNSWHAGIYPKSFYDEDAKKNPERWGNLAFGSPRFTHFHTCGSDPGQIAINVIDATISFDDQILWENGEFRFLELAGAKELLKKYDTPESAFQMRHDIGLNV